MLNEHIYTVLALPTDLDKHTIKIIQILQMQ